MIASLILVVNFMAVRLCLKSFDVAQACRLQQKTTFPYNWIRLVKMQFYWFWFWIYSADETIALDKLLNDYDAKLRSFSDSLVSDAISEFAARSEPQSSTKSKHTRSRFVGVSGVTLTTKWVFLFNWSISRPARNACCSLFYWAILITRLKSLALLIG